MCVKKMKTKREEKITMTEDSKRQKLLEPTLSPQPTFDNALFPLTSYDEDEDDEMRDADRIRV
ncbi:unnamed protein product, partial [Ilex paraguariensis]